MEDNSVSWVKMFERKGLLKSRPAILYSAVIEPDIEYRGNFRYRRVVDEPDFKEYRRKHLQAEAGEALIKHLEENKGSALIPVVSYENRYIDDTDSIDIIRVKFYKLNM